MKRRDACQRCAIRHEDGQALIEFALVLPMLLLLIFGMVQFGFVLNARQTATKAAQAAASMYAQTLARDRAGAEAVRAAGQLRPRLAPGDVRYALHDVPTGPGQRANATSSADVPISADGVGQPGQFVIATVNYRYPSPIRAVIAGFHFPDSYTISAEGVARIEKQGTAASGGAAAGGDDRGGGGRKCYFVRMQTEGEAPSLELSFDGSLAPLYASPGTSHTRDIRINTATGVSLSVGDSGVFLPADQSPLNFVTYQGQGYTVRILATYAIWPGCP